MNRRQRQARRGCDTSHRPARVEQLGDPSTRRPGGNIGRWVSATTDTTCRPDPSRIARQVDFAVVTATAPPVATPVVGTVVGDDASALARTAGDQVNRAMVADITSAVTTAHGQPLAGSSCQSGTGKGWRAVDSACRIVVPLLSRGRFVQRCNAHPADIAATRFREPHRRPVSVLRSHGPTR